MELPTTQAIAVKIGRLIYRKLNIYLQLTFLMRYYLFPYKEFLLNQYFAKKHIHFLYNHFSAIFQILPIRQKKKLAHNAIFHQTQLNG